MNWKSLELKYYKSPKSWLFLISKLGSWYLWAIWNCKTKKVFIYLSMDSILLVCDYWLEIQKELDEFLGVKNYDLDI